MSQQKAQLVSPIDTFTPPGINVTGAGIITATSFVGSGGTVTSIADSSNLNVGVITATTLYGDGSGLTGVAAAGYVGQTTAAQSGTTTIDLSLGNIIYFTQDTDTTVAFASTESVQELLFIRTKDDTTDARTITWPESIIWNGGTAPTLIDSSDANDVQIFNISTRDQGVTWYGYEAMKSDPAEPLGPYYAMGDNSYGNMGDNSTIARSSPHQIAGGDAWASFGGNYYTTIATKTDGTLWAWGTADAGALGQNNETEVPRSSPIQIPGTQWSTVSRTQSSYAHFAIKTDGTLWCWGSSQNGSHGQNNTDDINYSSPVQIPGTQWSYVDGGFMYLNNQTVLGRKTDNTLWVWGGHNYGSSGLSVSSQQSIGSPTQLPGTWVKSSSAGYNQFGLNSSGQLYSWGYNNQGQGGMSGSSSSPRLLGGTQWTNVYTMKRTTYATKTDGTLWSWGYNNHGQLGQNNTTNTNSPVQVPGTQWDKVINNNGRLSVVARKTDGTLWGWGQNSNGQLGQNDKAPYSSPVQIPGTWNGPFGSSGSNSGPIFLIP